MTTATMHSIDFPRAIRTGRTAARRTPTNVYEAFCNKQRARYHWRAAARAKFEAVIVDAERRARMALHEAALCLAQGGEVGWLDCLRRAKGYKRDAIYQQHRGGSAKLP